MMIRHATVFMLALGSIAATVVAPEEVGTASGHGTIDRYRRNDSSKEPAVEAVSFSPQYSYAYGEGVGARKMTWIVLTDKKPPVAAWASVKDRAEARRLWCEKEKASFVAVKLNATWGVELYFLCPGNGWLNTEMVSTINGLDSVVVKLDSHDAPRVKGTLRGGEGSCGDADGKQIYCTQKSDYAFDAPLSR